MAGAIILEITTPALAKSFLCRGTSYETRNEAVRAKAAGARLRAVEQKQLGARYLFSRTDETRLKRNIAS